MSRNFRTVPPERFELPASGFVIRRAFLLRHEGLVRRGGNRAAVDPAGIEPAASRLQDGRSSG